MLISGVIVVDTLGAVQGITAAETFLSHSSSIWRRPICWKQLRLLLYILLGFAVLLLG